MDGHGEHVREIAAIGGVKRATLALKDGESLLVHDGRRVVLEARVEGGHGIAVGTPEKHTLLVGSEAEISAAKSAAKLEEKDDAASEAD
jgi:hypothetical protein